MTVLGPPVGTVPPQGWYVEVDIETPDGTGRQTIRPTVEGEPQWTPAVNELPTVKLPVAPQDYFVTGRADSAPCRVWRDGQRLPIEEIDRIEREEGNGRDTLSLHAIGGVELNQRVQRVYQNIPAHNAVRNLITSETNLVENVDDPKAGSTSGTTNTLLSLSTSSEFSNTLSPAAADSFGDAVPIEIDTATDTIKRQQTSWLWVASDTRFADQILSNVYGTALVSGVPNAADDSVLRFRTGGDEAEGGTAPTMPYTLPGSAVGLAIRLKMSTDITEQSSLAIDLSLDGVEVGFGLVDLRTVPTDFVWRHVSFGFEPDDLTSGGSLNVNVETDPIQGNESVDVDAVAVHDTRLDHSFDDSPDPHLDTPAPYGSLSQPGERNVAAIETGEQLSTTTLSGARTEITLSTPPSETGVRVASSMNEITSREQDVTQETVEPGSLSDRASGTVTLSGGDTQSASPATGISPHEIDTVTLTGLVTAEQRLIGSDFDDDILAIIQDIAETVGAIFAVGVDNGALSLEWSRVGLRDSQGELSATAISLTRETQTVRAATVLGGRVQRRQEFAAPSPGGGSVSLDNDRLVASTERVATQSGTTTYEAVTDYQVDYIDGSLSVPSGSALSGGESLVIEYQYRPTGRFEADSWSGDPQTDQAIDIPTVTTAGAAEQAARQVVRETADARTEATVDLSEIDPGTSVVSALGIDRLAAISDSWRVGQFVDSPSNPQVQLSTARPVNQVVSQLEREFGKVRERI